LVVVLVPRTPREFAPQSDKPVMDQVGQAFGPEVLLVRTGEPVEFRNSDDTLHNVHVDFDEKREPGVQRRHSHRRVVHVFLQARRVLPRRVRHSPGDGRDDLLDGHTLRRAGCADGRFAFDGVPPGAWTITVFAAGKRLQRDVEVGGGLTSVTVE
jgi:hypothetical protein